MLTLIQYRDGGQIQRKGERNVVLFFRLVLPDNPLSQRVALPYPVHHLREQHLSLLTAGNTHAVVNNQLQNALLHFFQDEETWREYEEHDYNLTAAQWMKLSSALFAARTLRTYANLPIVRLGSTPFRYQLTDTVSGLVCLIPLST